MNECHFTLSVDNEEKIKWIGEENEAILSFYQEIRKLDCKYRVAELRMRPVSGGIETVRIAAFSDGRST